MFPKKLLFTFAFLLFTFTLAGCGGGNSDASNYLTRDPALVDKKVVIVEFSDFNCPACRSATSLAHEVCADTEVYCEFRHFPLPIAGHETSRDAANAYECAVAQSFSREMENALFDNQGKFTPELIANIPQKYGFLAISRARFDEAIYQECFTKKKYDNIVADDLQTAMTAKIDSTPTFVVNGKILHADTLKEEVAQILQKSE